MLSVQEAPDISVFIRARAAAYPIFERIHHGASLP
ncbi:hypothetical protein V6Z12_A03G037800 [Gossypium hirsutum]